MTDQDPSSPHTAHGTSKNQEQGWDSPSSKGTTQEPHQNASAQKNKLPFPALLFLGSLVLAAFAVGGSLIWYAIHTTSLSQSTSDTVALSKSFSPEVNNIPQPYVPVVSPDQVLAEAQALRGQMFSRGQVGTSPSPVVIQDSMTRILPNGSLEIALFAETLNENAKADHALQLDLWSHAPAPIAVFSLEFKPLSRGCDLLSLRRYNLETRLPATAPLRAEVDATQGEPDIKKLSCIRRKGEVLSLAGEGSLKGNETSIPWQFDIRAPIY